MTHLGGGMEFFASRKGEFDVEMGGGGLQLFITLHCNHIYSVCVCVCVCVISFSIAIGTFLIVSVSVYKKC